MLINPEISLDKLILQITYYLNYGSHPDKGARELKILVTRPHHKYKLRCGLVGIYVDFQVWIAGELHDWGELRK